MASLDGSEEHSRRRKLLVGGAMVLGGLAGVRYGAAPSVSSAALLNAAFPSSAVASRDDAPDQDGGDASYGTDDAGVTLTIRASNAYTDAYGEPAKHYPFMTENKYDYIVEPHRRTKLSVACDECGADTSYTWKFTEDEEMTGTHVIKAFPMLQSYPVTVTATSSSGAVLATDMVLLLCRYVRREIRQLTDSDRDIFFDAMEVMWTCRSDNETSSMRETTNCTDIYGPAYRDIHSLTTLHAALAGDKTCDHMHDGLGFLTQHMGLTLSFEQSLQSIDPSISMPYWDFTIDMHNYESGKWSSLEQSPMWKSDWYGEVDPGENTVTKGRWAYIKVETDAWHHRSHNSYGYLRAPWNNNNAAYVTRSHNLCGVKFDMVPSCEIHYKLINDTNSWFDFAWQLPYAPHGPVHQYIGGTLECNDTATDLVDMLTKHVSTTDYPRFTSQKHALLYLVRTDMFLSLKNLYRDDRLTMPAYCSLDTPYADCHGTCTDSANLKTALRHNYTDFVTTFWDQMFSWDVTMGKESVSSKYRWLDYDLKVQVIEKLCDGGMGIDGDHLESASPLDPSFWPIHPTIERLYMYKKLTNTFINDTWPEHSCSITENCYGHMKHDVIPFQFSIKTSDDTNETVQKFYTNHEVLELASPEAPTLPYVYADFEWQHCKEAGYDFDDLINTKPVVRTS